MKTKKTGTYRLCKGTPSFFHPNHLYASFSEFRSVATCIALPAAVPIMVNNMLVARDVTIDFGVIADLIFFLKTFMNVAIVIPPCLYDNF